MSGKAKMASGDSDLKMKHQPKRKGMWKALKIWSLSPLKMVCRVRRTMLNCKNQSTLDMDKEVVVSLPCRSSRREEENLRRLIKTTEIKLQLQINVHKSMEAQGTVPVKSIVVAPIAKPSLLAMRSSSIGSSFGNSIAPIDEESPCYFPGSFKKRWSTPLPRSGSCGFSGSS